MARTFAVPPASVVPLGTTWEESWQLLQEEDGPPVDLTGYEARMQVRDPVTRELVLELSTDNGRLSIVPADGEVNLTVAAADTWIASPLNARRRCRWDCELYQPAQDERPEYVIPLFSGLVVFMARETTVTQPEPIVVVVP